MVVVVGIGVVVGVAFVVAVYVAVAVVADAEKLHFGNEHLPPLHSQAPPSDPAALTLLLAAPAKDPFAVPRISLRSIARLLLLTVSP